MIGRIHGTMFSLEAYYFLLFYLVCQYPSYIGGTAAEIFWASSNLITPLQTSSPAVFQCGGQGTLLLWYINGDLVVSSTRPIYESKGFIFSDEYVRSNMTIINTLRIPVTVENNNTHMRCHATGTPGPATSETFSLTIAGPPLTPQPVFHVINATHIEVEWDKPFALPGFDVRNYTLSIWNTSSNSHIQPNQLLSVSTNTEYPIRYLISNGGNIPDNCVYLNFTLTASSDAGISNVGFTTGGFAIAPKPIDRQSLNYEVTFSTDITPMLHINFTLSEVCDYQDVKYSILIFHDNGSLAYRSIENTHDQDSPDSVEIVVSEYLQKDLSYTAQINVSSAVTWTTTQFQFDTIITPDGSSETTPAAEMPNPSFATASATTTTTQMLSTALISVTCVLVMMAASDICYWVCLWSLIQ